MCKCYFGLEVSVDEAASAEADLLTKWASSAPSVQEAVEGRHAMSARSSG